MKEQDLRSQIKIVFAVLKLTTVFFFFRKLTHFMILNP